MPHDAIKTAENRPQSTVRPFEDHYKDAVYRLRSSLIEAYQAAGADSESPREAARTLQIDKNLTWKLGKIINEDAIERVASSIPGNSAVQKVVQAFQKAGVDHELVDSVRNAFSAFDNMVEIHTGDREALDLLLDSMAISGSEQLVKSRKLAFKGNSGVWGAQAKVRVNTSIIAPSKQDPSMLDYAQIGGYTNLQRLRPNGAWPLFRMRYFNDDGSTVENTMSALIDDYDPSVPHLLPEFTSGENPSIVTKDISSGLVYELSGGRVGKTSQCSLYYGYTDPHSLCRYQDAHNELGQVLCLINIPTETVLMDLLVHRDFAADIDPSVVVYGRASGDLNEHEARDPRYQLPVRESLRYLGENPILATPHIPRYTDLVELAFNRCGFDASEFVAWRLVIPYPPMTSTIVIGFALPEHD